MLPINVNVSSRVTEQRAPTDESVRLLREMESRAKEEIIKSIRLENCPIGDTVIEQMCDSLTGDDHYAIFFKIAGKTHRADYIHKDYLNKTNKDDIMLGMRDALAKKLSEVILGKYFEQNAKVFFRT